MANHALMIDAYINDLKVSRILSKTAFLSDVIKKSSMAKLSHQKCPTLPEVVKTKVSNSGVVKTKVSSSNRGVLKQKCPTLPEVFKTKVTNFGKGG